MSGEYDKIIQQDLKALIKHLLAGSIFEDDNPVFKKVLKHWTVTLKKSDTMYYASKADIDKNVDGMIEKFCFHGCFKESEILRKIYKNYIITDDLPKNVCMNRLAIVKFLLCMSENPTQKLLDTPYTFKLEEEEKEKEKQQDINWAEYLNQGIEKWQPNFDDSEDSDSASLLDEEDFIEPQSGSSSKIIMPTIIKSTEKFCTMDLRTSRDELTAIVQHTWYHSDNFQMVPESHQREANIGILWEDHIRDQVKSLILLENPSIISEYSVIREILWQLWCPHTSTVFEICGNNLKPKSNVTLASVRQPAFYSFMESFISYIEILIFFRDFEKSLGSVLDENVCVTYRCYWNSLNSIIEPIYKKLSEIETTVREQESTYTLQNLAHDLSQTLEPLKILKEIHQAVILDFTKENTLICATNLIARLHDSLHFCVNKLEQDLKVTLFLDSCSYYFSIINSWLITDNFTDFTGEFVIQKKYDSHNHPNFVLKDGVDDFCKNNTFLRIFYERVLQIGRNINLLRLLGKYDMIGDFSGSLYREFIQKIFERLATFYHIKNDKHFHHKATSRKLNPQETSFSEEKFIFPVISSENQSCNSDLEKLENLIDTSDGFLMNAFADFFIKKEDNETPEKVSLFQNISNYTKNLFPKTNFFENTFLDILNERFTVSGLLVKKLLVEQHSLDKQFEFLRHLYLFWDDLIFPFYRRLFEDATFSKSNKIWAYELWLTSNLQDIFMDLHPEFYDKCSITVKEQYTVCNDPLKVSNFLSINFEVSSPLNVIIQKEQIEKYQEIFQIILTLKWALHTVNHLAFTDLEPKSKERLHKTSRNTQKSSKKLIKIKFSLINILHSLQHFIFGSICSKNFRKFELDFEKAKDLSDLIESHSVFINTLHASLVDIKKSMVAKDNTNNVLNCIRLLKQMWNNENFVTLDTLKECRTMYDDFCKEINPIVFPVYIYDY